MTERKGAPLYETPCIHRSRVCSAARQIDAQIDTNRRRLRSADTHHL